MGAEGLPQDEQRARSSVHVPVLVREALEVLDLGPGMTVVDGTIGAGGHGSAIAAAISPGGFLLGIDRDAEILGAARAALDRVEAVATARVRYRLHHLPFPQIEAALAAEGLAHCDRVLLDLGVSSLQLDAAERGFSFMNDGPLDMRMDRSSGRTVADWLALARESEIARVIFEYGEERHSRRIAKAIVAARDQAPIRRTHELKEIVVAALPGPARHQRLHAATRTFQALRIAINDELAALEQGLAAALRALAPGGRLAVIAFHSLEDRIVKQFVRARMRAVTRKPIVAGAQECCDNPRARSAKLRCAERLPGEVRP